MHECTRPAATHKSPGARLPRLAIAGTFVVLAAGLTYLCTRQGAAPAPAAGAPAPQASPLPPTPPPASPVAPQTDSPAAATPVTANLDYTPPGTIDALRAEEAALAALLVAAYPGSANAHYVAATVHEAEGRHGEAEKTWERCLALDPRFVPAYERLGAAALDRGEFARAEELYRKVIVLDRTMPGAFDNLASALLKQRKLTEALEALAKELENSPASSRAYFHRGRAYVMLGQYAKAEESYAKAVALRPGYKFAYYGLAQACDKLGRPDEAAAARKKFEALEGDYRDGERAARRTHSDLAAMRRDVAVTHVNAGEVYKVAGNLQEAERQWKIAAVLDPSNLQCVSKLAALYERTNRPAQALAAHERLMALEPGNALHHFNAGNVHFVMRQFDAAERAYRRVVALAPERADGYRALVQLYLHTAHDPGTTLALAKDAVRLGPSAPNFFNLALAHHANGELVECRAALERARSLDPGNAQYAAFTERLNAEEAKR